MRLGRSQPFKPQVKKVLLTGTVSGATGSAAGVATGDATGAATSAQVASSTGTSTATFFSAQSSIFTATGAATVSGVGAAINSEIASCAGAGQGAAVSASTSGQVGSSAGVGAASGVSAVVMTVGGGGSSSSTSLATGKSGVQIAQAPGDGGGGQSKNLPYGWWNSPKFNAAIRAKKPLQRPEREVIEASLKDPEADQLAQLISQFQTPKGIDWHEIESEQATQLLRQVLAKYVEAKQEAEDEEAFLMLVN